MKLNLEIWRQAGRSGGGHFVSYTIDDMDPNLSILEMLDALNEKLLSDAEEPVAFDSDCREGICGACGITVNGQTHGPEKNTPSCHQRLSRFRDGDTLRLEPLRSESFEVIKDLVVDRSRLDLLLQHGGYVSIPTGTAPDADEAVVGKETAEIALDYAACIGCGACVAACPNGAAHLYAGAKLTHLASLPLPSIERTQRAKSLVKALDQLFGPCSLYGECAQACPANIPLTAVAAVNHERIRAGLKRRLK